MCSLLGLSSKKPVDLFKRDCDHTHITLVIPDLWQLVSIFQASICYQQNNILTKDKRANFQASKRRNEAAKTRNKLCKCEIYMHFYTDISANRPASWLRGDQSHVFEPFTINLLARLCDVLLIRTVHCHRRRRLNMHITYHISGH